MFKVNAVNEAEEGLRRRKGERLLLVVDRMRSTRLHCVPSVVQSPQTLTPVHRPDKLRQLIQYLVSTRDRSDDWTHRPVT